MTIPFHPSSTRRWRHAVAAVLTVLAASGVLLVTVPDAAQAATASTIQYSLDGGATWSASASVAPGATVLVRQWFDNTGTDTIDGAQAQTTLPGGFAATPGTTKVCLDPSTVDPSAPDDSEQACATVDDAVWSGADLAVSPTAGHFGLPASAAAGPLAAGRVRYLNLHQCVSWSTEGPYDHTRSAFLPTGIYTAGSNVAATADSTPTCSPANFTPQPNMSGVTAFALFDRRYLNLQQCRWVNDGTGADARSLTSVIADTQDGSWSTGSTTSNAAHAAAPCAGSPASGWTATPDTSGTQSFDILEDRYLNLHECWAGFAAGTPSVSMVIASVPDAGWATGTSSSDTPATMADASCTSRFDTGMVAGTSAADAFDLLDTRRSAGYATYEMTAPSTPGPQACAGDGIESFTQTASLATPSTPTVTSTGTLAVDWARAAANPCTTTTVVATTTTGVATTTTPGGPTTTQPTTSASTTTPTDVAGRVQPGVRGSLARTGLATGLLVALASGLVAVGAAAIALARRARATAAR